MFLVITIDTEEEEFRVEGQHYLTKYATTDVTIADIIMEAIAELDEE